MSYIPRRDFDKGGRGPPGGGGGGGGGGGEDGGFDGYMKAKGRRKYRLHMRNLSLRTKN